MDSSQSAEAARRALHRTAILWAADSGDFEAVVRAACDALVAGWDGECLRALAGMSVHTARLAMIDREDVAGAVAETGGHLAEQGSPEARLAGLVEMARDALAGHRAPRDVAAWAHRYVGHDGADSAQSLVCADDDYDLALAGAWGGVAEVDAAVLTACAQLIAASPR